LPVTCTLKEGLPGHGPPPVDVTQTLFTINVPVVGAAAPLVLGTPLFTLFADRWLQESDTLLSPPAVSQFAFCLVSWFRILESANTVSTFIVDIPVTNTVVNRINAIGVWLWRLVLSARFANIYGLSRLILSYIGLSVYIFVY
jgi:hypothetical protein